MALSYHDPAEVWMAPVFIAHPPKERKHPMKCNRCGFPDTRPGLIFENGICGACLNFAKRKEIDWEERKRELAAICDKYRGRRPYDCLIPVSGGKDSHTLVKVMEENGMHPILFNVADWFTTTKAGKHNLDNLCQKHELIIRKMGRDFFVKATRAAFEATGEALKLIEYFIYLWPIQYAQEKEIPLVVFGEDSAFLYGTSRQERMAGNEQIEKMVAKLSGEIGFFENMGISPAEIKRSLPEMPIAKPMILWMSYFRPWSSVDNLEIAREMGFKSLSDLPEFWGVWKRKGLIDDYEQIDSIAYITHLQLKYIKFAFSRATDIATRRLREGRITRQECDKLITENDHLFDPMAVKDFCDTLGYTEKEFFIIVNQGWNK